VASSSSIERVPRRGFLARIGGLLLISFGGTPACRRPPRREEVLDALVREVMAPELDRVVRASADLTGAAARLAEAPGARELEQARVAWKRAALSWKRVSVYRDGPLTDTSALVRAAYWPARREGIDEILRGSPAIDPAFLDRQGADLKGLYGLEYLLFDPEGGEGALARFSGEQGRRSRDYVRACAGEVRALGERAAQGFGLGGADYARALSHAPQEGINRVVSQMIQSIEGYVTQRLALVLWLGSLKRLRRVDVEGGPGRISTDIAVALLESSERLYSGSKTGGLASLARHTAPKIHERVQGAFGTAISTAKGLGGPLEDVVESHRHKVEMLMASIKALEIALKSDLASALGVTLDFASGDAD
jgi:predicted lipoprotein